MQFLCFRGARRGSGSTGGELSPEPSSSAEHSCTSEEPGEPACSAPQAAPVALSGSGGRPTAQTLDLIASLEAGPRDDASSSSPHQPTGCYQQDTSAAPCWDLRASIDSRRCSVGSGGSGRRPSTTGVAEKTSSCTLDAKPPGRISTTDALLVQLGQAAAAAMDAPSTTTASAEAPLAGRYSGRLSSSSGGGGSRNSSSGGAGSSSRAHQVQRAGEVLSASARAVLLHKVSAALAAGAELGEMLQSLPAAGGYARKAASRQQTQQQMQQMQQMQQRRRSLQGMRAGVAATQPHRHMHTWGGGATSPDDSLAREVVQQQQQQCQAQKQHQEQQQQAEKEQQEQECHEQLPAPAAVLSGQQQGAGFRRLSSLGSLPGLGATASTDLLAALSDSEVLLLLQSVQGEVQILATQQEEDEEDEEQACGNQLEPIAASVLTRHEDHCPSQQPAAQGIAAGSSGGGGKQAAAAAKALRAASSGPLLLHERQPLMLLTDTEWGADWQPRAGQHEEEEDAAAAGFGACGPAGDAAAAEACGDRAPDAGCAPVGAVLTHRLMTYEHVTTVVWCDSDTAAGAAQRQPPLEAASETAAEPEAAAPAAAEAPAAGPQQPVCKAGYSIRRQQVAGTKPAAGAAAVGPEAPPARSAAASARNSKKSASAPPAAAGSGGAATRTSRQAAPSAAARRLATAPSPPLSPAAGSAARAAAIMTAPPSSGSSSCAQRQERAQLPATRDAGRAPGGARGPAKAAQPAASMAAAAASGGAAGGLQQRQGSSGVRHKEEVAQRTPAPAAASPFAAAAAAGSGVVSSPRPAVLSPRPSAATARLATHTRAVGVVNSRGRSASPTKSSPHRSGTLVAFGRTLPRLPSPDKLEQREPAAAAAGVEPLSKQGRVQASLQGSKQQRRRQPGRAASLPAGAPAAGSNCLPPGCGVTSSQLAVQARPPSLAAAGAAAESLRTGRADGHAVHPEPGSHLLLHVPSPTTTVWGSSGDWGQPSRPPGLLSCPVAAGSWLLEAQQHCHHHSCERLFSGGSAATPGAAAAGSVASGLNDILSLVRQLQGNLAGLEADMQQLNGVLAVRPRSPTGHK